jgi:hypothetical protein
MTRRAELAVVWIVFLFLVSAAVAAPATVVLAVEGMT